MSITGKGKRWEFLHSLWIGWTFTLGIFNWIAFLYIGWRARQGKWVFWGLFYMIPLLHGLTHVYVDDQSWRSWGDDLNTLMVLTFGAASIFHAFRVRNEYLLSLVAFQRKAAERVATLKRRFDTGTDRPEETQEHSADAPEKGDNNTLDPTLNKPATSSNEPLRPSPATTPEPPPVTVNVGPQSAESERPETISIPANYPLPLAYSYRLVDAEFETFRTLKELYRNAENLTAFLASLALALAPNQTGRRKNTLLRTWQGKGATFGSWYAVLDKVTPTVDEEKGQLYGSMKHLLGTQTEPSSFAETMAWLIDQRNDFHHGDLPVGTRADRLVQEARRRFEHCVSESATLWQHPLRLVLDYDAIRNSNYVIATCLDFSGDHPVGRKVQERYQGIPKKHDLYILQDRKEWISLYPFVSVQYCSHCNARETYFVDAWQGSGEVANLRSFERAHEEVSQEIGQELTLRLG